MTSVSVVSGDPALIEADALITLLHPGRKELDDTDRAIQRVARNTLHDIAAQHCARGVHDRDVVIVTADESQGVAFKEVLFVVDEFESPLAVLVENVLRDADMMDKRTLVLPTLRTVCTIPGFAPNAVDSVLQMAYAVSRFVKRKPRSVEVITIVVNDDAARETLEFMLSSLEPEKA